MNSILSAIQGFCFEYLSIVEMRAGEDVIDREVISYCVRHIGRAAHS